MSDEHINSTKANGNSSTDVDNYLQNENIMKLFKIVHTIEMLLAVTGTLLCLWFLVAILTSRDLRERLRNKILCNTLTVCLLECVIIIPMTSFDYFTFYSQGCSFYSAIANLSLIQDFIVNWLVVILLVVFIAQIQDFNPKMRLMPRVATLGSIGLLLIPWVASVIIVPVVVLSYTESYYGFEDCFIPAFNAYHIFKSIDTVVPIILAILLLITASGLRYKRLTWSHSSDSMEKELIDQRTEVDNIFAYVAVVVISSLCDLLLLLFYADAVTYEGMPLYEFVVSALIIAESRVILMPLSWLLFPDIRQRIRSWKPWTRPATFIDLMLTNRREENK